MSQIAQRYGRAFFELAQEKSVTKEVTTELLSLGNLIAKSVDLQKISTSKIFSHQEALSVFNSLAEALAFSPLTQRFVAFLISEGRLSFLEAIAADFKGRWQKDEGIVSVCLTAAKELDDEKILSLKKELEAHFGKKVDLETKIQKNLVGGMLIQVGSVLIDLSLKTKLNDITAIIRGA